MTLNASQYTAIINGMFITIYLFWGTRRKTASWFDWRTTIALVRWFEEKTVMCISYSYCNYLSNRVIFKRGQFRTFHAQSLIWTIPKVRVQIFWQCCINSYREINLKQYRCTEQLSAQKKKKNRVPVRSKTKVYVTAGRGVKSLRFGKYGYSYTYFSRT